VGQSCLNFVCGVLRVEGVCTMKVQQGSMELRMCGNRILVLPVNILTVWCTSFTWPHDTLLCVLIGFVPKSVQRFALLCPFYVLDPSMHLRLIVIFVSVQKDEE